MAVILNDETVEMDTIYAIKKQGHKVIIGDLVRSIKVNRPNGEYGYFYRKDGNYLMEHAGEVNVGEYDTLTTIFPEYTTELQEERTDLISMVGDSVDDEINTLEEAYNV